MALLEEFKSQGDFLFRYRSFLPLIILVFGYGVFLQTEYYSSHEESVFEDVYDFICLGVSLFGLFIRVIIVGHTPPNTSGRCTEEGQVADSLNTTGMYSMSRHPLYLGNFFMWLGVAMLTKNIWFLVAFVLFYYLYYERIMYAEESFLRNKFGATYLEWASKVPAFIPSLKNYKKNEYAFQLKKVLRQEKNGLAAVFLLFWFFELSGEFIEEKKIVIEHDFWFYAAIISVVLYVILKIMKRKRLLGEY